MLDIRIAFGKQHSALCDRPMKSRISMVGNPYERPQLLQLAIPSHPRRLGHVQLHGKFRSDAKEKFQM